MTVTTLSPVPPGFWSAGACHDLPAEWFHPERGQSTSEAKAVCATCHIRVSCLEWALANNERFGVWGGTCERERRRIRRRLAAGEHIPQLDPDYQAPPRTSPTPPPPKKEPAVDLVLASPEPAAVAPTNGSRPIDPDTGLPTDVCVNCGKRYTPVRKDQRFHTEECARAWYSTHPRGESGKREPRIRARSKARASTSKPVPAPDSPRSASEGVDLPELLGQLLTACDRWAIEADLGDIRISVTRRCP